MTTFLCSSTDQRGGGQRTARKTYKWFPSLSSIRAFCKLQYSDQCRWPPFFRIALFSSLARKEHGDMIWTQRWSSRTQPGTLVRFPSQWRKGRWPSRTQQYSLLRFSSQIPEGRWPTQPLLDTLVRFCLNDRKENMATLVSIAYPFWWQRTSYFDANEAAVLVSMLIYWFRTLQTISYAAMGFLDMPNDAHVAGHQLNCIRTSLSRRDTLLHVTTCRPFFVLQRIKGVVDNVPPEIHTSDCDHYHPFEHFASAAVLWSI